MMLEMANGSMAAHISEFPVGTYKKAHRHGPGFNVIIIKGVGFSMFWREGEQPKRYDWQDGSVFTPPAMMWHQHFNTGATGARYLPPRLGGIKYSLGESFGDITKVDKDVKAGGNQPGKRHACQQRRRGGGPLSRLKHGFELRDYGQPCDAAVVRDVSRQSPVRVSW